MKQEAAANLPLCVTKLALRSKQGLSCVQEQIQLILQSKALTFQTLSKYGILPCTVCTENQEV